MYSREQGHTGPIIVATTIINVNSIDNKNTNFNHDLPTRVLIGGFDSDRLKIVSIKNEYFLNNDYNVVIATWKNIDSNRENKENYIHDAGMKIFTLLDNICDLRESPNTIFLVGHGVGAHIAGYAGYLMTNKFNKKFDKIFALDPKYENTGYHLPNRRLHATDAYYVETILTTYTYSDSGPLPTSHADYIVNDYFQISCNENNLNGHLELFMLSLCAHNRVLDYFVESINSNIGFWGMRRREPHSQNCSNISKMGELVGNESDIKKMGVFALTTNLMSPYARGKNIVPNILPELKFLAIGLKS